MKSWQALLGIVRGEPETRFGPYTKQLTSVILVLQHDLWYQRIGEPSELDDHVVRVKSWSEAWSILDPWDATKYTAHGMLLEPARIVNRLIDADSGRRGWWQSACELLHETVEIEPPPSESAWSAEKVALTIDYPDDLIHHLLKEIIVQDLTDCTFFREQFPWLAYGYLPCGWDGAWPAGKPRVY